jgi:hypothetical protein
MHRREDAPGADPQFAARQRAGGLGEVWTDFEAASAQARVA